MTPKNVASTIQLLKRRIQALLAGDAWRNDPGARAALPGAIASLVTGLAVERGDLGEIAVDPRRGWGVLDLAPECAPLFAVKAFRWWPGASTLPHDHPTLDPLVPTALGVVSVVSGELEEEVYGPAPGGGVVLAGRRLVRPGAATRMEGRVHIHRLGNPGALEAHSLHVYAPAVSAEKMRDYPVVAPAVARRIEPAPGLIRPEARPWRRARSTQRTTGGGERGSYGGTRPATRRPGA